jgi:signal transduction histidine kinase
VSKSFEWFKKHASLREEVYNIERSNEMAQLQTRFDLEKKDQQIELLEAEKKLEANKKRDQFIIALIVVFALVLITVILVYTIKQKQKSNNILSAQKKYSEELNQLKDRLFSIISHDLRSPLHNISGLLSLADNKMMTEHELKEYLSKVGDSTENLSSLIDNLLYWAKSNLRNEGIKRDNFAIDKLAERNVSLLQPQADNKKITITNEVRAKVKVFADYNMIDLVVRNLVSNAIKFTKENGEITLSAKEDNKMLIFFVKDTGVGISQDKVSTLFNIQNTSTNGTNDEPGTGLGLILCKEFVEKNGGTITVQTVLDKGSTFSFTLPVSEN